LDLSSLEFVVWNTMNTFTDVVQLRVVLMVLKNLKWVLEVLDKTLNLVLGIK